MINPKNRALLQKLAVEFNTTHKAVMETDEGKRHAVVSENFAAHVQSLLDAGENREEIDQSLGGKVKPNSPAYKAISRLITDHNAKLGLTGASGGGGGATEQTEANEKASEAAEKAVKEVKDKPFQARYKSALDSFANTKFQLKLKKLGENATELEIAKAWNNSYASAKDNVQKLVDIANSKAELEKPKVKSNAKKLVKANKMPTANLQRIKAKKELVK